MNANTIQAIFLHSYLVISEVISEVLLKFSSQSRACDHTLGNPFLKIPFSARALVSFAAVFWMSRNAPPKERCVTSKRRAAKETTRAYVRVTYKRKFPWGHHVSCVDMLLTENRDCPAYLFLFFFVSLFAQTLKKQNSYLKDQLSVYKGTTW